MACASTRASKSGSEGRGYTGADVAAARQRTTLHGIGPINGHGHDYWGASYVIHYSVSQYLRSNLFNGLLPIMLAPTCRRNCKCLGELTQRQQTSGRAAWPRTGPPPCRSSNGRAALQRLLPWLAASHHEAVPGVLGASRSPFGEGRHQPPQYRYRCRERTARRVGNGRARGWPGISAGARSPSLRPERPKKMSVDCHEVNAASSSSLMPADRTDVFSRTASRISQ
jgi:hypothetical protein